MRYLLTCFALFMCSYVHAQFEQWDWVKYGSCYGAGWDTYNHQHTPQGNSIAVDAAKNVYVLGAYYDTTRIDTFLLYGNQNMFLAKYAADGKLLWLRSQITELSASWYQSYGSALSVDAIGNIYIGGVFRDSIILGPIKLFANTTGIDDIFLAKYDGNGNVIWAKRAGGPGSDVITYGSSAGQQGGGLRLDGKGNLYFTGYFGGGTGNSYVIAQFDAITLVSDNYFGNAYIAKYDTAGNAIWVKKVDKSNGTIIPYDLAFDHVGNVVFGGMLAADSAYFGNIKVSAIPFRSAYCDLFLAKYDINGNALWARSGGGNGGTLIASLVTDSYDNIIVTGDNFSDSAIFGNIKLYSNGKIDNTFIAKYTDSGNIIWVKNIAADYLSDNYPNYMTIDGNDKCYITGVFKNTLTVGAKTITSNGGNDIYVARYDMNGNMQWITSFGGSLDDPAFGLFADNNNTLYITGNVLDTCSFGSYNTSGDNANMFVAKLSLPTTAIKRTTPFKDEVLIYPNPTSSDITIDLGEASFTQLLLSDALGRSMYARLLSGKQKVTISAAGLVDGLYFVILSGANRSITKKVIVQR